MELSPSTGLASAPTADRSPHRTARRDEPAPGGRSRPAVRREAGRVLALATLVLAMLGAMMATAGAAPQPPATDAPLLAQCPPAGASTGCSLLITLKADGTKTVEVDKDQLPYDGSASTLIGVKNESGRTLLALTVHAANANGGAFDFQGNGPCQYVPAPPSCSEPGAGGTTGYSGPGNEFSAINGDFTQGTIDFLNGGLRSGKSQWFALAQDLVEADVAFPVAPVFVPGSRFHPVVPDRVLDSRDSLGFAGPLAAGTPKDLKVTGAGTSAVPTTASAVVMNVAATESSSGSFLTIWPSGIDEPNASNINFGPGQTIANLVTVQIGTGGKISFATNNGSVQTTGDIVGYYDDGSGATGDLFTGLTPARLLDSRLSPPGWPGPLPAGTVRDLAITGAGSSGDVPDGATAVAVNLTVTNGSDGSYLTVWPSGVTQPSSSNINFSPGETIPSAAVVKIGANGKISFANHVGNVNVVVDVVGYFHPSMGSRFHVLTPGRFLDTRLDLGISDAIPQDSSRSMVVTGKAGIAPDATSIVANTTATNGTAGSYVSVYPDGADQVASSLNFGAGETIANLVTVKVGTAGGVRFYNNAGAVDLVGDAVGYYGPPEA